MKPIQKYRLYEHNELIIKGNLQEIVRATSITYHVLGKLKQGKRSKFRPTLDLEPVNVLYAGYKGDEFVCMGTIQEVSRYMGITERNALIYSTPSYRERSKEKTILLVRLDDDEE